MKKSLFVVLVIGSISLASFFYVQKNQSTKTTHSSFAGISPSVKLVAENILPDTLYTNLTGYEKTLIDRFLSKYSNVYSSLMEKYGNSEFQAKSQLKLKYYDSKIIVLAVPSEKVGRYLGIYTLENLQKLNSQDSLLFGNYVESNSYIIITSGSDFLFYKKGATDFKMVHSSSLNSKMETYIKEGGLGNIYDFTFDEQTRTLTASIFKPVFKEGIANPKIRTVKFILE